MRTYSHALLTFAIARKHRTRTSVPALLGAILPDLPVTAGGAWLLAKRGLFDRDRLQQEVCAKRFFATPDAALHSVVPLAGALCFYALAGIRQLDRRGHLLSLLVGWAGHVAADALSHGEDARPLLWPLSRVRFTSPVSYWEGGRNGRLFTLLEHAALLYVAINFFQQDKLYR